MPVLEVTRAAARPRELNETVPMNKDDEPTAAAMNAASRAQQLAVLRSTQLTPPSPSAAMNICVLDYMIYKSHIAESEYHAKFKYLRTRPPPAAPEGIAGEMRVLLKECRRGPREN